MHLNSPETIPSPFGLWKKLSSMKPVSGAKRIGSSDLENKLSKVIFQTVLLCHLLTEKRESLIYWHNILDILFTFWEKKATIEIYLLNSK